jgi:hypothetical protein
LHIINPPESLGKTGREKRERKLDGRGVEEEEEKWEEREEFHFRKFGQVQQQNVLVMHHHA